MMHRIKIQKVLAVVFLTALIWVWSDLALDDTHPLTQVPVGLADSSDPSLLVNFVDEAGMFTDQVIMNSVTIKGPLSQIEDVKRQERSNTLDLHLLMSPDQEGLTEPMDTSAWSLLNFVRQSSAIRNRGLTVENCTPATVSIQVVKLVQRTLRVRCLSENGTEMQGSQIQPPTITMYVPESWSGDRLTANVTLTDADTSRARGDNPVDVFPYVDINGRIRESKQSVKVRLTEDSGLKPQFIEHPKCCLNMDPVVQRDFSIVISREVELFKRIDFLATDEAKRVYQNEQSYHVELVITGREAGQYSATLQYRFPRAYVEKNQIKPGQVPLSTIDYELVPRTTDESTSVVAPN